MKKKILLFIIVILATFTISFVVWTNNSSKAEQPALDALTSDSLVSYTQEDWIVFSPIAKQANTGFIFYPGGKVEPEAYAPALKEIAAQGYLVVNVPMPLNLAVFAINKADEVIEAYPEIESWVIGGHCLGGSMAAAYAQNNQESIDGLIFWASYPGGDMTDLKMPILSIYGTNDMGIDGILESDVNLPNNTIWEIIEGGNHAQFGYYGEQEGDGSATISAEDQQHQIIKSTLSFLDQFFN